eukprot:TRINITY_DN4742_c0_g2_i1.p1 TRINITY_DN4742_c0_g2~~TRINITY_DN4742_c0_g2_i1.p1  ORF type:complete len:181 (-),score=25.52 TRINITY_DN4742_c0_g2_i1:41-583(-)
MEILSAASSCRDQGLSRSIVPVPEASNQLGQDVAWRQQPQGHQPSPSVANLSDIQSPTVPPLQPPALSQADLQAQQQQRPAQCSALVQGSNEGEAVQPVPPTTPKPRFRRWAKDMLSRVSKAASSSSNTTTDVSRKNLTSTKTDANAAAPPAWPRPNYSLPRPRQGLTSSKTDSHMAAPV